MGKSVFMREFRADIARSVCSLRFVLMVAASAFLMAASEANQYRTINGRIHVSVVDVIGHVMAMDKFKVILVILMAVIYTKSFCDDYNSSYLRGILTRIDATRYAQSRVVANVAAVVLGSLLVFAAVASVLSIFLPLASEEFGQGSPFTIEHPVLYIFLMGLEFGLVTAACTAVGLMFSAFQPNAFVSIALAGMVLFLALSYIPAGMFSALGVIQLMPVVTKGREFQAVDLAWCMLYPVLAIYACGLVFRKRLEWRVKNGCI